MISTLTQAAIAILHDISSGDDMQSADFLFSEGEREKLFDELEKSHLIRLLPDKKPGTLSSYVLCRPLPDISLLDVLHVFTSHCMFESSYAYATHGMRHIVPRKTTGQMNSLAPR